MLRKIFLFLVLSFMFLVVPKAHADENFDISTNATYKVSENGLAHVTQRVQIRNKTEFIYTPSYAITTGMGDLINLRTYNNLGELPNKVTETKDGGKNIEINFSDKTVGLGRINEFTISFDTNLIARRKGSIWEVNVPGLSDPSSFVQYNITLETPASFGPPTIAKPYRYLSDQGPYSFTKNEIGKSGILILFGKSQYYFIKLVYHIQNSSVVPVKTEIALPPETSYQDIRIEKIVPEPEDTYQDEDGNWLAVYSLAPREKKTINAQVFAHVFAMPIFDLAEPRGSISSAKYWEVNDPEIKKIAQKLETPGKIYDYVVSTLSYNYDKVESKNVRLGASGALKNPDFAVCLEFTDLFVALARAAGIPARSVEGYAYTQDSKLRPLSLVRDVLHSWPEYYDQERKAWIMVDPTWTDTTGGMDYFNSFDLDHIAFVVKGNDSMYPVPAGGYKLSEDTKDVNVAFSDESSFRNIVKTQVLSDFPDYVFPLVSVSGQIIVENQGNMAVKNRKLYVKSDLTPSYQEFYIDSIPPYGKKALYITFNKSPFLTNKSHNITILFEGNSTTEKVLVGFIPDYYLILIGGVIILGSGAVSVIAYKTWSLYFQKRKKQANLRGKGPRS
ncbi:MAG: hypothetical protein A3C30_01105 [Candidatus Levybacteria bacterium RIFCSPHIGHO2_02_FULL_40_18]|nr:MAG: hypothetical protein A2869_03580 [Candidatus Levybacteria bacterium RIFCSPHIGHO2_01_FULL_40_58]OGH27304.1 MAG: hypothetical protein A3C30_01105 [Candidatus Levybacteria bacterium RIFCSPHIGHO2_02_FULL_40_18]OGH30929.1 MAG: hypothetical protein A3E43_04300 [Candidatus Levybacteria bacterium RIFCSPHIGHO2_12_FULL_40_31]OGH40940.1 MAG: hypothetical protein A2894_01515 [Candidatus Levybacteria bacterium RIFCSPLOWO2_01_FULL_40_64]OGH48983.1 MAG: hypothetical protein A3I54_03040 [Candidatus Lev